MYFDRVKDEAEPGPALYAVVKPPVSVQEGITDGRIHRFPGPVDAQPVSCEETDVDHEFHFPEINMTMRHHRHLNHIHHSLVGPFDIGDVAALVVSLELVALYSRTSCRIAYTGSRNCTGRTGSPAAWKDSTLPGSWPCRIGLLSSYSR